MFMVQDASAKTDDGRVLGGGFHDFPVLVGSLRGFPAAGRGRAIGCEAVLVGEEDRYGPGPGGRVW